MAVWIFRLPNCSGAMREDCLALHIIRRPINLRTKLLAVGDGDTVRDQC
jgi:hypothetical protein